MQFIFVFEEGSWRERLRGWYADEVVRADLPHVQVFVVDGAGQGEAINRVRFVYERKCDAEGPRRNSVIADRALIWNSQESECLL